MPRSTNRSAEIGYWLGEDCQGRGIVTAACRAMVHFAFKNLELERVEIYCAEGNLKSRAVPARLRCVEEGKLRHAHRLRDGYHDLVIYSILADEYREENLDEALYQSVLRAWDS